MPFDIGEAVVPSIVTGVLGYGVGRLFSRRGGMTGAVVGVVAGIPVSAVMQKKASMNPSGRTAWSLDKIDVTRGDSDLTRFALASKVGT